METVFSETIIQSKGKAENLESLALDYFYKAEILKQNAEDNPADAKKMLKNAAKLMTKGQKAHERSRGKFARADQDSISLTSPHRALAS